MSRRPTSWLRRSIPVRRLLCSLACGWAVAGATLWPQAAQAQVELWGYVDRDGVAHFSTQPLDSRFSPVLRSPGDETGQVPGKSSGREGLLTWLEFAPEVKALQPLLRDAAAKTGVDVELLKAIIAVESGFKADLVSPRGATGLMQIMPATAERYAGQMPAGQDVANLLRNPRFNILVGARMLADLARRFGGVDVALAAWNAGEGTVRRAGGQVPPIAETQAHVHLVLELYWALLQHRQHRRAQALNIVPQKPPTGPTLVADSSAAVPPLQSLR